MKLFQFNGAYICELKTVHKYLRNVYHVLCEKKLTDEVNFLVTCIACFLCMCVEEKRDSIEI